MTKEQKANLSVAITLFAAGQLLSSFYRPYIYANQINDFGFADTIGSLVAVPAFCFFLWSLKSYNSKTKSLHILGASLIYSFVWESMGLTGLHGTFDWKDIIAALISGALTFAIKELVERRKHRNSKLRV